MYSQQNSFVLVASFVVTCSSKQLGVVWAQQCEYSPHDEQQYDTLQSNSSDPSASQESVSRNSCRCLLLSLALSSLLAPMIWVDASLEFAVLLKSLIFLQGSFKTLVHKDMNRLRSWRRRTSWLSWCLPSLRSLSNSIVGTRPDPMRCNMRVVRMSEFYMTANIL